jgi:2-polyprenyl-6-methoxyphenol hydroxylase-like FAD-dependent oxidoreductase
VATQTENSKPKTVNSHYDVIIAGGGPGGSTCALTLKHSGLKVLMLEKDTFPRDKICGDAVSSTAKRVLRQIDPTLEMDLLEYAPKANITKAKLYSPKFESLEVGFSLTGHCIRRMDFDNWLFNEACKNPTLEVLQNTSLKDVTTTDRHVTITTNHGQTFTANVIVGCDGAHSIVAKKACRI